MNTQLQHSEYLADKKADRRTYAFVLVFVAASWLVLSWTAQTDGQQTYWHQPWVQEATSHIGVALAALLLPALLTKFPISRPFFPKRAGIYLLGFLVFSCVHLGLMTLFRKALYPVLFEMPYSFGAGDIGQWAYEMSKDAYTFGLLVCVFYYGRHLEQLRMEVDAAREDARTNHRLTLKSGGRTIFLGADEVIWAKAASNYVEVRTQHKTHLARMTLSRLETLLAEAGNAHVQCHRSYIVSRAAIREIVPTGEGDAALLLTSGEEIPASRRYRERLTV